MSRRRRSASEEAVDILLTGGHATLTVIHINGRTHFRRGRFQSRRVRINGLMSVSALKRGIVGA